MNSDYYRLTEAIEVWVRRSGQKAILKAGAVVWIYQESIFSHGTEVIADLKMLRERSVQARRIPLIAAP